MHLMAQPITANYGINHGITLAIIMPAWVGRFYKTRPERYVQFAERIFGQKVTDREPNNIAVEVIDMFETWMKTLGVQTRLSEFGIGEDAIEILEEEIIRTAFGPGGKLASRVPATKDDIREVLKLAL